MKSKEPSSMLRKEQAVSDFGERITRYQEEGRTECQEEGATQYHVIEEGTSRPRGRYEKEGANGWPWESTMVMEIFQGRNQHIGKLRKARQTTPRRRKERWSRFRVGGTIDTLLLGGALAMLQEEGAAGEMMKRKIFSGKDHISSSDNVLSYSCKTQTGLLS
jgi:hypothetical protein